MKDERESNGIHGKWTPVLVAIIGAVLGGTGTVAVVFGTPIGQEAIRPDPFTGTQASALETRVDQISAMVSGHIYKHPDDELKFDRRIATLEAQYTEIIRNQGRILDRLDGK